MVDHHRLAFARREAPVDALSDHEERVIAFLRSLKSHPGETVDAIREFTAWFFHLPTTVAASEDLAWTLLHGTSSGFREDVPGILAVLSPSADAHSLTFAGCISLVKKLSSHATNLYAAEVYISILSRCGEFLDVEKLQFCDFGTVREDAHSILEAVRRYSSPAAMQEWMMTLRQPHMGNSMFSMFSALPSTVANNGSSRCLEGIGTQPPSTEPLRIVTRSAAAAAAPDVPSLDIRTLCQSALNELASILESVPLEVLFMCQQDQLYELGLLEIPTVIGSLDESPASTPVSCLLERETSDHFRGLALDDHHRDTFQQDPISSAAASQMTPLRLRALTGLHSPETGWRLIDIPTAFSHLNPVVAVQSSMGDDSTERLGFLEDPLAARQWYHLRFHINLPFSADLIFASIIKAPEMAKMIRDSASGESLSSEDRAFLMEVERRGSWCINVFSCEWMPIDDHTDIGSVMVEMSPATHRVARLNLVRGWRCQYDEDGESYYDVVTTSKTDQSAASREPETVIEVKLFGVRVCRLGAENSFVEVYNLSSRRAVQLFSSDLIGSDRPLQTLINLFRLMKMAELVPAPDAFLSHLIAEKKPLPA